MKEIWNDISGYEGYYQASSFGRVKRLSRTTTSRGRDRKISEIIIKPTLINSGYYNYSLYTKGKRACFLAHRLVAIEFISNKTNKKTVNHKDGNKLNNHYNNLEWATYSENHKHAFKLGLRKPSMAMLGVLGSHNPSSKAVSQYSIDGSFIKSFGSGMEAKRETGVDQSSISANCRGIIQKAGGFVWKFENKQNNNCLLK